MGLLAGFGAIFLFILGALVGCGMGIGALLHWLVPAIDLGVGTLIGVVAMAFAIQFFTRIIMLPNPYEEEDTEGPASGWRRPQRASRRARRRKHS